MATKKLGRRTTLRQLKAFLDENAIDYRSWKKPRNKTVEDLHRELRRGICTLRVLEGRAVRMTREVAADVCHPLSDSVMHVLAEQWQTVSHGREKHTMQRGAFHTFKAKVNPDEPLERAVRRGLREKIGWRPACISMGRIRRGVSPFMAVAKFLKSKAGQDDVCGIFEVIDDPQEDAGSEGYPELPTKRDRKLYVIALAPKYYRLGERVRERGSQRTAYSWSPKDSRSESYLFHIMGMQKPPEGGYRNRLEL